MMRPQGRLCPSHLWRHTLAGHTRGVQWVIMAYSGLLFPYVIQCRVSETEQATKPPPFTTTETRSQPGYLRPHEENVVRTVGYSPAAARNEILPLTARGQNCRSLG